MNNFIFTYVIASHLKILIPVGTEMIIVADAKYAHPLMAHMRTKFHEIGQLLQNLKMETQRHTQPV
jgi:hypothetical protein